MAVTPLIKPVQDKKGIFYNFQSALEDINITLSNSDNAVRFSKFALLRIPEIGEPNNLETDNKIQFAALGETAIVEGLNADNNVNLAESFQNYALNFETLLISRPQYKKNEKLTVSERVFWKWLKELGAIRFQDANALEKNTTVLGTEARFVEKTETSSTYNKVVKYVGDIDVVNTLKSNENSYTEVYIHVPTTVGTTPYVLFKSVKDDNYFPNMTVVNNATDPLNIEYLAGRNFNDTHPFGLSLKGYYDLDDQSVLTQIKNSYAGSYSTGNWFNSTINNAYYTDNYNNTSEYNVAADQFLTKQLGLNFVEYPRTTLDGISIDFDLDNYKLASENPEIKVFSQFNDYVANRDFEFNAILVYYDTYDPNNLDSSGSPIDLRTNLYGVLFLDKIQQDGLEFSIPAISKYRPNPLNKTNGNAFSFKLNLKLDTSAEDAQVQKSINDYSTFSLELFTDVLTQFKQLQTRFNDKLLELDQLQQDVNNLRDLLINLNDLTEVSNRLTNLETSVTENQAIFNNTGEIVKMIENTNDRLNSILNGTSNITISYDLSAIRPGLGIGVDTRTPGIARISNLNQSYNISNNSVTNVFSNNVIDLVNYTNYVVHQNGGISIGLANDLEIFINDTNVAWKKGQVLRLVFEDELDPGIFDIKIYTDALNKNNTGIYGKLLAVYSDLDFSVSSNKPIFEIVCLDDVNFVFRIDKIR
ncbi:hypothetical protein UFOVP699_16 [uncultured Caudovirales phage]|uniref:Uncharacterized protein n=1 Tax=uncultured Caudovirales phage TaxID=2100421 RepID=A0A6J5NN03_9CAUD|nr:hypothetical protein UFOVP699_16 [uncultured Caudovirales phage]